MANPILHPEAQREFLSSLKYYKMISVDLSIDFNSRFIESSNHIDQSPLAFQRLDHNCRRCQLEQFPYCIIYHIRNDQIIILAVAHTHQKPGYWKDRLPWSLEEL